jgi:hypothetical protein
MSRWLLPFLLILGPISAMAIGQTIDDRFGVFEIEKSKLSKGFSVLIERVRLEDTFVDEEFDDDDDATPKIIKTIHELSSRRVLQRVVFGGNGKRRRLDGTEYLLAKNSSLSSALVEAQLIDESKVLYLLHEPRRKSAKGEPKVIVQQLKDGQEPMNTETKWKHPFGIATSQAPLIQSDKESPLSRLPFKVYSMETLKDGRDCFWVYVTTGGIFRMVFNKDQSWIPEEIDFWLRELTVEEEIARKPLPELTPEILKKSHCYCKSRIEWKEVSNRWVPWNMRVSYNHDLPRPLNEEHEIRFRDWKFQQDYDRSLLDEANFTSERIRQSIDFQAISDFFDKEL